MADGRLSLEGLGATADEVAATIMATKFGIKAFAKDFADYRAAQARVAATCRQGADPVAAPDGARRACPVALSRLFSVRPTVICGLHAAVEPSAGTVSCGRSAADRLGFGKDGRRKPEPENGDILMQRKPVSVDLGLQGGGAHGAFTWGVIDRLLDEPWIGLTGVSGTSAGAMNAAVLVDGFTEGGRSGAQKALERYWRAVANAGRMSPMQRGPIERMANLWTLDYSPVFNVLETAARMMSPYDTNPGGSNPLRAILTECIDFDRVAQAEIKLFVNATNVRTGRGKLFRNADITPEVLMASACLPTMFQAVEIDGEFYWDGGFSGNPSIVPLVRECDSRDTIIVQINPIMRPEPPRTAREIQDRLNEIAFNSVLIKGAARRRDDAQGGRPRHRRGAGAGRDAAAPDSVRRDADAGLFFEAAGRMGFLHHAAGRGPQGRRGVPDQPRAGPWGAPDA